MNLDEQKLGAVLHRMADEAEWKPGLPRRTVVRASVRRSFTVAVTLVLVAALGYGGAVVASAFSSSHRAAAPRPSGKIAFAGPDGIYVVNPDGSELRRVTRGRGDVSPSWSPDGKRIVFQRDVRGRENVFVIASDGSNLRPLTTDGRSAAPAWSPTGGSIAFTREFPTHGRHRERILIFEMRPDGSGAHRASSGSLQYETSPAWSPDGRTIAFAGFRSVPVNAAAPIGHIYLLSGGGTPRQVGDALGDVLDPVWAPDGHTLLFVNGGPQEGSLSTMTTAGGDLHALTRRSGLTYSPAWSPDGHSVVFAQGPSSSATRLYTLDLMDGGIRALTPADLSRATDPSWWGPRPAVTPSPTTSPRTRPDKLLATAHIPVPSGITGVVVSADAVWVAGFQKMTRIDPQSGRIVATIAMPGIGEYSSVALGAGSLWVTGSEKGFRGLYKIDPATNKVADQIPLSGYPTGVTVGGGSVWVTRGRGNVVRIDATSDRIIGQPIPVGVGPGPIVYAAGMVYVTNTSSGGSVSRIDPVTGSVTTPWGVAPDIQAFGAGSLWSVRTNLVSRIDLRTGRIVAQIPLKRAAKVTFEAGRIWAITGPRSRSRTLYLPDPRHPGTVVTIDPATNLIASDPVPYGVLAAYIDVHGTVAWIGDYNKQILTRVELKAR
jgi:Tol biopolymer transport system component/streptogramin lyase